MKEYIENVLAPKLQGDGGWVEFVSYELLRSLLSARSHSSGTTCDARVSKSQADHVCMRKFVTLRPECF